MVNKKIVTNQLNVEYLRPNICRSFPKLLDDRKKMVSISLKINIDCDHSRHSSVE